MTNKEKRSLIIYRTIAYMLNAVLVTDLLRTLLSFASVSASIAASVSSLVRNAGYIIALYIVLKYSYKNLRIRDLLIFGFFVFEILFTLIIHNEQLTHYSNLILILFLRCIPAYLICRQVEDYDQMINSFKPYVIIGIVYACFRFFNIASSGTDYMVFSYSLLIPAIVAIYYALKGNQIYIMCSVFLSMIILIDGARGTVLCIAASLVFSLIILYSQVDIKRLALLLVLAFGIFFFILNYDQIFMYMYRLFPESRNLITLNNYNLIQHFSGRVDIYDADYFLINQHLITGVGVFSDRYLLSRQLGYAFTQEGIYAHNFVLEVVMQFGIFVGSALLISILLRIIRSIYYARSQSYNIALFLTIFASSTIVHLMISGSYIEEISFWAMLGFMNNVYKRRMSNTAIENGGLL